MEKLFRYIQFGSGVGLKYVFLFSCLVCFVFASIYTAFVFYPIHNNAQLKAFIEELPEIEISDGVVVSPENVSLSFKFPGNDTFVGEPVFFTIDTTRDAITDFSSIPAGIILTSRFFYIHLSDQNNVVSLPQEGTYLLSHDVVFQSMDQFVWLSLVVGLIIFFAGIWIGFALLCMTVSLFFWISGLKVVPDMIARCCALSWISILTLDVILILSGYGFSLMGCLIFSVILALFVLLRLKNNVGIPMEALKAMQDLSSNEEQKTRRERKSKKRFFGKRKRK